MFRLIVLLGCLGINCLLAAEPRGSKDTKTTILTAQENKATKEITTLIQNIGRGQTTPSNMNKLQSLLNKETDIKILDNIDISLDDYEKFFNKIRNKINNIFYDTLTSLWKIFVSTYSKKNTMSPISPEPKIQTPYATIFFGDAIFFSKYFPQLKEDISQDSTIYFKDMVLNSYNSLKNKSFSFNNYFKFLRSNNFFSDYILFSIENLNDESVLYDLTDSKNYILKYLSQTAFDKNEITKITRNIDFSNPEDHLEFEKNGLGWFYDSLKQAYTHNILPFFNDISQRPQFNKNLNLILPILYKDNFKNYSKIIFSNLSGIEFENATGKKHQILHTELGGIIYNQEGYTKNTEGYEDIKDLPAENSMIKIGNPLILENYSFEDENGLQKTQNIPIGYNIHLPKGEIKGVIINVYGGYGIKDRVNKLNRPEYIGSLEHYLLSQGIAVVTLNLIDLLELTDYQLKMPKDIHHKLHASINYFYQALRTKGKLFQDFVIPGKTKIFLYGSSFGGRTAIRHAELYPATFDGYISHDGGLTGTIQHQINKHKKITMNPWVSVMDESLEKEKDPKIEKIQDPILLLHNFDDNNVNIKVTLEFYNKALNTGKENLIHLFITRRGNPLPLDKSKSYNKGHFVTEDEQAFKSYAGTIASFILEELPESSLYSRWMAHQYEVYANKNYLNATLEEQFISEAYRLYKSSYYGALPEGASRTSRKQEELVEQYKSIPTYRTPENLSIETSETLKTMQQEPPREEDLGELDFPVGSELPFVTMPDTSREAPLIMQQNIENIKFEEFWQNTGRPLYYMTRYLGQKDVLKFEVDFLNTSTLLTDTVIQRALVNQLPNFLNYLRETFNLRIPYKMDLTQLANNSDLKAEFLSILNNYREDAASSLYQLKSLYEGNPDLMKQRIKLLQQKGMLSNIVPEANVENAKKNLHERIKADKDFIVKRLTEMGNLNQFTSLKSYEEKYSKIFEMIDRRMSNRKNIDHLTRINTEPGNLASLKDINPIFAENNKIAEKYRHKILRAYQETIKEIAPHIKGNIAAKTYVDLLLSVAFLEGDNEKIKRVLDKSIQILKDNSFVPRPSSYVSINDYLKRRCTQFLRNFPASKLTKEDIDTIWGELGENGILREPS